MQELEYQKQAALVGGHNYGQGSSRDMAITPRYGVQAVGKSLQESEKI